jgi:cell division protein FtsQ
LEARALQQVGTQWFFADASPVDPALLPVPMPNRTPMQRAVVTARHNWVLHRRAILRTFGLSAIFALGITAYELRDPIGAGATALGSVLQGEFADAGFAVDAISISGQSLTSEAVIFQALAIQPNISTLSFDAEAARARLEELPAVEQATIRKVYPGNVLVTIVEKVPVARWRVDGVTWLVDMQASQIAVDTGSYPELPLVVGTGANDDALVMLRSMERFELIRKDLAAISRIGDRRWDLIYYSGLRVQLPETGVAQALGQLESYQQQHQLLDRDVTLIDLRVPGIVAYKLAVHEDTEAAAG